MENKIELLNKKINEIENTNRLFILEKAKSLNDKEKEEKRAEKIFNYKFTKNPQNLKFVLDINNTNDYFGRNDIFEVFVSVKDLKTYLISKNKNYNLDVYSLENNTLIKTIKHLSNHITITKYFLDKNSNKEYLLTADENKLVTLWDLSDNFKILYEIKSGHSGKIYSGLLVFGINGKNMLLIPSRTTGEYTKIYDLETGKYINNLYKTNNNPTYYLLYWFNIKNEEHYIIELCDGKTSIHNLFKDEIYAELKSQNEYRHFSGFIYNKNNNDYLCNGCGNGYIHIWDLFNKSLNASIYVNSECYLHHIIQWNDKYAIIADVTNYHYFA